MLVEYLPYIIKLLGILLPWACVAWKFKNISNPKEGVQTITWILLACIVTIVVWIIADPIAEIIGAF